MRCAGVVPSEPPNSWCAAQRTLRGPERSMSVMPSFAPSNRERLESVIIFVM